MSSLLTKALDLRSTTDATRSIQAISEGVHLRGYNVWLLVCSAILASIGLDTNSSAVIIGAMLVSPLMSPILGIGLSVGILDNNLLWRALRNFGFAVLLSLGASILYFMVSPFGSPTSELQSRTYPTLLDVMVAFFGGVAGIIASSRTGPTIALPGVAIATALMPPLCTAGYGIARNEWLFFGGAFYLFFINAVFISLATFLIVKYLRFPEKKYSDKSQRKKYFVIFSVISFVVLLPSIYFLYTVYQREYTRRMINELVLQPIRLQGNEILKWQMVEGDTSLVKVYYSGNALPDSLNNHINHTLSFLNSGHYKLNALRVNMTKEEVNKMSTDVSREMFRQLQLEILQREAARELYDTAGHHRVQREVKVLFPDIDSLWHGRLILPDSIGRSDTIAMAFYRSRDALNEEQLLQLRRFLSIRLQSDSVALSRYNNWFVQ